MLNKLKNLVPDARALKAIHCYMMNGGHLLINGVYGTGKNAIADTLARYNLCLGDKSLSCTCPSCVRELDLHPDFMRIRPDAGSIKKEQIDELLTRANRMAQVGRRKVYVIEDAEMLTLASANSLLKLLEDREDKNSVILINNDEVLDTISSRCASVTIPNVLPAVDVPISDHKLFEVCTDGRIDYLEQFVRTGFYDKLSELKRLLKDFKPGALLEFFGAMKENDNNAFFENSSPEQKDAVLWLLKDAYFDAYLCGVGVNLFDGEYVKISHALSLDQFCRALDSIKKALQEHRYSSYTKNDWFDMLVQLTKGARA